MANDSPEAVVVLPNRPVVDDMRRLENAFDSEFCKEDCLPLAFDGHGEGNSPPTCALCTAASARPEAAGQRYIDINMGAKG